MKIDLATAVSTVTDLVKANPDKVAACQYTDYREDWDIDTDEVTVHHATRMECIAGAAVGVWGVTPAQMVENEDRTIDAAHVLNNLKAAADLEFEPDAIDFLRAVQTYQDSQHPWGEAFALALANFPQA